MNPRGLYIPELEKDACGTGLIADLNGRKSHQLVADALTMLENMEHRGACGFEANTGDGAGILVQAPHDFFMQECAQLGFSLPEYGRYGVGMVFFPIEPWLREQCRVIFDDYIDELGFDLLGYRPVPTNNTGLGASAIAVEPWMEQVFVQLKEPTDPETLERRLYVLRKFVTHQIQISFPAWRDYFYIPSFSYKTLVYKGQLTTFQLRSYFSDLQNPAFTSAIALVHSRFSTNTTPKWKLAQPLRYIAHNGEINTITGNLNWWKSREKVLESPLFEADELEKLKPICGEALSDSGNFDNVLEFLVLSGFSLAHALMMMIPEAWEHDDQMEDYKRAFYEYHKTLMESWDGPASICFTDGIVAGAMLDRNGLRPSRYVLTDDERLIIASEAGALPVDQSKVLMKGRLQPGKILIADLKQRRLVADKELKAAICKRLPYREWLDRNRLFLRELPANSQPETLLEPATLLQRQQLFGFTREDLKMLITPMVKSGDDPVGSMGADTPLAVLSQRAQHLSNYFKQLFAQVTNPPIDPIRERSVMSLYAMLGGAGNMLDLNADRAQFIHLPSPILNDTDFNKIKYVRHHNFRSDVIDIRFKPDGQRGRLRAAIHEVCARAEDLVRNGVNILILSDRQSDAQYAPIPSLLAVSAVHHHLIREGLRGATSIVVEAGDIWETHHIATLAGYGASAVNPYMAYATIAELHAKNFFEAQQNVETLNAIYNKALGKGLLKIMSKIGISTFQSYQGAQIFEALGIHKSVIDECFTGTVSRIQGIGFDEIAREVIARHQLAYPDKTLPNPRLDVGGVFQWKQQGEAHLFNPQTIHLLQYSTRKNEYTAYRKYAKLINEQNEQAMTLRGLLTFRKGKSIPIEEVEPIENIFKRFATGAMSFGSLSHEAHATLAIAMNRIGAKSNSGEGGEDEIRYEIKENGDWERSAVKQVASGRFGVTSHYLTNADELQIKMAQGAKPGEGGQLPGHKVDDWIGRVRHATPGVSLISPPPHHDIYSIEDLAQLIFDLKNANPAARVSVKLVSKAGVGIIASGVAKAHADAILISGHDGGTGASPLTSIRHAGLPWELGLAETQQVLVKNKLRDRVTIQADGQIRTGRDLAIATLLGAEEWGISTAALVVEGCILMRKCHLNTCPVGVATQDPELRKKFTGDPQHVINFFTFLAEDLREIMATLGFRTVEEMVGRVEMLRLKSHIPHWKYKHLDLTPILYKQPAETWVGTSKRIEQDHGIADVLDRRLIHVAEPALEQGQGISSTFEIRNTDRATGTMLSHEVSKRYGSQGLPDGTIQFRFRGSAGQSFGAFGARGLHFILEGESNDYFGKGLSGARLIVVPDRAAKFDPAQNIIIGNVALYGATSGEAYIMGMAGERFAVRNSGAIAVIEGLGDHGCEYMTGGTVVVLGETGKNFAAGMSGGVAFVYNPKGTFERRVNAEMVDLDPLDATDYEQLITLIRRHFHYTGSNTALQMLNKWTAIQSYFIKVMPRDYKAVLLKKRSQVVEHQEGVLRG